MAIPKAFTIASGAVAPAWLDIQAREREAQKEKFSADLALKELGIKEGAAQQKSFTDMQNLALKAANIESLIQNREGKSEQDDVTLVTKIIDLYNESHAVKWSGAPNQIPLLMDMFLDNGPTQEFIKRKFGVQPAAQAPAAPPPPSAASAAAATGVSAGERYLQKAAGALKPPQPKVPGQLLPRSQYEPPTFSADGFMKIAGMGQPKPPPTVADMSEDELTQYLSQKDVFEKVFQEVNGKPFGGEASEFEVEKAQKRIEYLISERDRLQKVREGQEEVARKNEQARLERERKEAGAKRTAEASTLKSAQEHWRLVENSARSDAAKLFTTKTVLPKKGGLAGMTQGAANTALYGRKWNQTAQQEEIKRLTEEYVKQRYYEMPKNIIDILGPYKTHQERSVEVMKQGAKGSLAAGASAAAQAVQPENLQSLANDFVRARPDATVSEISALLRSVYGVSTAEATAVATKAKMAK